MIKFKSSAFCSGNQLCIEEVYNYHDCFVKVMEYIATTFVISFSQSLCIGPDFFWSLCRFKLIGICSGYILTHLRKASYNIVD